MIQRKKERKKKHRAGCRRWEKTIIDTNMMALQHCALSRGVGSMIQCGPNTISLGRKEELVGVKS